MTIVLVADVLPSSKFGTILIRKDVLNTPDSLANIAKVAHERLRYLSEYAFAVCGHAYHL